ncbi:MAG TPA: T9SS type A sorting domain-containing protein [Flavobacterium sp.]|nr:T9SS type A sorting domain-containing protein [Flavobacterium sp.]
MKKALLLLTALLAFNNAVAQCYDKVATGYEHTLVIKSDGTLYSCGSNTYGQLGRPSTFLSQRVLQQVGTESDWQSVATGARHSLAVKTDGSLWACGINIYGELGNGTNIFNSATFIQVGSDTNWLSIAAGSAISVGLKTDGSLWAWGHNQNMQLGDGTNITRNLPVQIGTADWQAVSCGVGHIIALKNDGTIWGWGSNSNGQRGAGIYNGYPIQIGTDSNWQKVACGSYHSLAIKQDGSLWGWGANSSFQLGDDTTDDKSVPTPIGTATNWQTVKGGYDHTIGLPNDGSLWWWGENALGLLYGRTPTRVGASWNWLNFESVSAAGDNSAALQSDGTLYCWGRNNEGCSGVGSSLDVEFPTQIICSTLGTTTIYGDAMSVYPNPVKDILHIQLPPSSSPTKATIIDATGKKILEQTGDLDQISVSNIQPGMYLLQITSDSKTYVHKFIKS